MKIISRTNAVQKIKNSKGKFFTISWIKNDQNIRILNCNFKKDNITDLGYIIVNSKEGYKNINPRTIRSLKINKELYLIN